MKKLIFLFLIVFVSSCIDTSEENKQLKEINDPWYKEQILSDMVKY